MNDIFRELHQGLVQVHGAIRATFEAALSAPRDLAGIQRAASFLIAHHTIESEVMFPSLRRAGRLRSADVAFLDPYDHAHHELHTLCERILAAGPASAGSLARATLEMLIDHVAEEEVGLAPDRLRLIADEPALVQMGRDADALRDALLARQGRKLAG